MTSSHHHHEERSSSRNWSSINQWLLWIGLAAAVGWLFFRHGAHLLELAPFLLVLACPLMHLFGHGGHHGHGKHSAPRQDESSSGGTDQSR